MSSLIENDWKRCYITALLLLFKKWKTIFPVPIIFVWHIGYFQRTISVHPHNTVLCKIFLMYRLQIMLCNLSEICDELNEKLENSEGEEGAKRRMRGKKLTAVVVECSLAHCPLLCMVTLYYPGTWPCSMECPLKTGFSFRQRNTLNLRRSFGV